MNSISTREFKEVIKSTIRSGIKQPILGLCAPGVGMSEIVKQVGNEMGYHVEHLKLSQMSYVELCGIVFPNKRKTEVISVTPVWFPKNDGSKTILLLDEITSATERVQVIVYQLIRDRRLERHLLPEDTVIIALGSGGVTNLHSHLVDSFQSYSIQSEKSVYDNMHSSNIFAANCAQSKGMK